MRALREENLGLLMHTSFDSDRMGYSLSASPLSQAEMPRAPAFFRYDAFSALVQRTWICSVARSLAGKGGLPRLGLSMPIFDYTKKFLTRVTLSYILSTH